MFCQFLLSGGYNLETNLVQLECVCFQLSDSRMAICGTSDSSTLSIPTQRFAT